MKKMIALAFFSAALYSCTSSSEKEADSQTDMEDSVAVAEPTLTMVWETDTVMTTAESTLYDPNTNSIFVSNIVGDASEKDGEGFISKMDPDGTITQLHWVTGLNAPKGMAIMDGMLYVTDVDELIEINLSDSSITNRYSVPDATFLNDAATDGNNIYISDSRTGKIHKLEDGQVNLVTEGMDGINGLAFNDAGQLFILDGQGLRQYDMEEKTTQTVNDVVTGGDGLVIIDDSTYIASRWQGEIYLVKNGTEHLLLDTKGEESNTADIDYIPEENLVLVPTFLKNKVVAYKLDY